MNTSCLRMSSFVFASALVSTMAMAQSVQPAPTVRPTVAPPAMTTPAPGMATTATATTLNSTGSITHESSGEWRASKLKGLAVYNAANEKIGEIDEMMVGYSGKVDAVVIAVGGFLGMGEHQVAVPFSDLQFVDRNRKVLVMTGTSASGMPAGVATKTTTTTTTAGTPVVAPRVVAGSTISSAATTTTTAVADQYPDGAILNMTKDQLKAAPQFRFR